MILRIEIGRRSRPVRNVSQSSSSVVVVVYNRRIKVNDPKAREFIRGLKPGDEAEVTFREAFAVSVEPAR